MYFGLVKCASFGWWCMWFNVLSGDAKPNNIMARMLQVQYTFVIPISILPLTVES